jgi:hypothetical protein
MGRLFRPLDVYVVAGLGVGGLCCFAVVWYLFGVGLTCAFPIFLILMLWAFWSAEV